MKVRREVQPLLELIALVLSCDTTCALCYSFTPDIFGKGKALLSFAWVCIVYCVVTESCHPAGSEIVHVARPSPYTGGLSPDVGTSRPTSLLPQLLADVISNEVTFTRFA